MKNNKKLTKMKKIIFISLGLIIIFANLNFAIAQVVYDPPKKKLIEFGWNSPSPKSLKDSLTFYENNLFDGVGIKLSKEAGSGNVFMVNDWKNISETGKNTELGILKSIPVSKVLTDNFLSIFGGSQMDWFSDSDWATVEDQLKYCAKLAKAGHCKGVLWDPEPYEPGKNPWKYVEQEKSSQYSFEQYCVQVRHRGAQFIQTLQDEFPGLVVFSLRELSDWQNGSPFSGGLLPLTGKEYAFDMLKSEWWGLHVAFYVGILDGIKPGTTFIDGNEEAYYYTSAKEFYRIRNTLLDDSKALVPPELWTKHSCFNRFGNAISIDYITGKWINMNYFPKKLTAQGLMMSSENMIKWFEHNAYYSLKVADEYAWLYDEVNWWKGDEIPRGFYDALKRAKRKVAAGEPLGFDIEQITKDAQQKAEEFYKK